MTDKQVNQCVGGYKRVCYLCFLKSARIQAVYDDDIVK